MVQRLLVLASVAYAAPAADDMLTIANAELDEARAFAGAGSAFLKNPATLLRPFAQTQLVDSGEYERQTQAPLVFMKYNSFLKGNMPSAASAAAAKVAQILKEASASQSSEAETGAVAKAVESMKSALTAEVANDLAVDSLKHDAFILAHTSLKKQLYNGGCARDYAGAPQSIGNVMCGARDFGSMSQEDKEAYAWKCAAQWPCA